MVRWYWILISFFLGTVIGFTSFSLLTANRISEKEEKKQNEVL